MYCLLFLSNRNSIHHPKKCLVRYLELPCLPHNMIHSLIPKQVHKTLSSIHSPILIVKYRLYILGYGFQIIIERLVINTVCIYTSVARISEFRAFIYPRFLYSLLPYLVLRHCLEHLIDLSILVIPEAKLVLSQCRTASLRPSHASFSALCTHVL